MKPIIVISPSVSENGEELKLSRACFDAVSKAGGLGLVTDYKNIDDILKTANGILLSGGGDIEPKLTNDEADNENRGFIFEERDIFELELIRRAVEKKIPVLGICRGMQVAGAAFGGHIIQHFEGHRQEKPKNETSHFVNIKMDSLLYHITGTERLCVNSFHHQAVGDGTRLKISAVSDDGRIEAVEGEDSFLLGVQWHPEYLCENEKQMKIFKAFIEAAGRYKECYGRYFTAL